MSEKNTGLLKVSIFFLITSVVYNLFKWTLVPLLTPLIVPLLDFAINLSAVCYFFIVLGIFIFRYRKERIRSRKPLIISFITVVLIFFFPFTYLTTTFDFHYHLKDREDIISKIKSNKIAVNSSGIQSVELLNEYRSLSMGDIAVEKKGSNLKVLFFTFRGVLDNFSGFLYMSNNEYPSEHTLEADFHTIEKLKDHWFWVESY